MPKVQAASAHCSGAKVCILLCWRPGAGSGRLESCGHCLRRKRGPKPHRDPVADENQQLRREVERLTEDLRKADIVIDIQKKVAALLGRPILPADPTEKR